MRANRLPLDRLLDALAWVVKWGVRLILAVLAVAVLWVWSVPVWREYQEVGWELLLWIVGFVVVLVTVALVCTAGSYAYDWAKDRLEARR